jgi:hypothetical protein
MHFERLANNSAALIGCLAWIPLAVWILACVNWSIGGDIDPATGIIGIFMAFGLGYEAINPPVPQLAPLTVIAVLLTVLMFPFVRSAMDRRELRGVDIDALDKAYQSLAVRPDNVIAKFKIARVLFDLGMCGHALRIAESLVPHMPQRFFMDELRTVRKWQMMQIDARFFNPIACSECLTSNPAGNLFCQHCGSAFLLDFAKGKVVGKRLGKKLIATWIALIAFLVGIPAAKALPPAPCIAIVLTMITVAVSMVYFAFKDPTGGVAH